MAPKDRPTCLAPPRSGPFARIRDRAQTYAVALPAYGCRTANWTRRHVFGPGIPSAWATGGKAAGTLWSVHPPRSELI